MIKFHSASSRKVTTSVFNVCVCFLFQGEIRGLEESKKLLEEENQKLLERICALEDKQVLCYVPRASEILVARKLGLAREHSTSFVLERLIRRLILSI